MQFGIFDQNDRGRYEPGEQYENRLRLIEFYDRAGFRSYHMSEHHATPLNLAPSPSVFLAAVAQRTKRLRFGALVYVLPAHHPLRLAEELCMLDHLSRGLREITDRYRAEWTAAGHSPDQLPLLGINRFVVAAETDREAIALGRRAWPVFYTSFMKLWKLHGTQPRYARIPADFDALVEHGIAIAGS